MRVLFVSLAFPPKSDPEALQTSKYFHHLQKFKDLDIDVVTSALPTLNMPYDAGLEKYAKGIKQLISIPLREHQLINSLIYRTGLYKWFFPDLKFTFHAQYKRVLRQLKEVPEVIYSRSDPQSSTIMAYKLQRQLKVPWIMHMSDPWADCPMHNRAGSYYKLHNKWERKCFTAATLVSVTSIPTLEFYKKKYPEFATKLVFFPNVFERDNKEGITKSDATDKKFRIVYTGGLSGKRSPEFFLNPLSELLSENSDLGNKIEVVFAGDVDRENRAVFEKYSLPCVKWIGKISYSEALALQKNADLLMVIDNPITDASMSMFFPSKLLDYMVAGKRILAITTNGSATHLVMKDLKGDVCTHESKDKIKDAILNGYHAYCENNKEYLQNSEAPEKYEAAFNAARLHDLIIKVNDV